ncbi:MAG TPA: putative glycolipid-binding domain-containing protein [Methylomirabilota bacterium]|nr:putative glycolipid-binding domain-containing protein [Methylomirabilota bacterium]
MNRHVVWQAWTGVGLESCRITGGDGGVRAESVALGVDAGRPWAMRYTLRCDAGWRVRELTVSSLEGDGSALALAADGTGRWTGPGGERLAALDGCLDVDLSATAFTNTLPIRRLGMVPGWSEEITVVYVSVPGFEVSVARQRYHCLACAPDGGRYRFEDPASGFTAEIDVDGDGLVVEYPHIARQVWSR